MNNALVRADTALAPSAGAEFDFSNFRIFTSVPDHRDYGIVALRGMVVVYDERPLHQEGLIADAFYVRESQRPRGGMTWESWLRFEGDDRQRRVGPAGPLAIRREVVQAIRWPYDDHEAGHAVAQLAHPPAPWINFVAIDGLPAGMLGVVDTPAMWQPYMATVNAPPDVLDSWRSFAWRDALFYLAGPIAELRWRRHSRAAIWFAAGEFADRCFGTVAPDPASDLGRVRARLLWAGAGDERGAFIRAWLEAETIVATHWKPIRMVGRLLYQQGRLSDVELLDAWTATRSASLAPPPPEAGSLTTASAAALTGAADPVANLRSVEGGWRG